MTAAMRSLLVACYRRSFLANERIYFPVLLPGRRLSSPGAPKCMSAGAGRGSGTGGEVETTQWPSSFTPAKKTSVFGWTRWIFGTAIALFVPFADNKLKVFKQIQNEVVLVTEVVDTAAEVVEQVAAVAEKVSSEVADRLPEDGKLKKAAVLVENASKSVAEEAHKVQDIIHKVDEIEEEVEEVLKPFKPSTPSERDK